MTQHCKHIQIISFVAQPHQAMSFIALNLPVHNHHSMHWHFTLDRHLLQQCKNASQNLHQYVSTPSNSFCSWN